MSRWVRARPSPHSSRTLRAPDGVCLACGEDVPPVAIACARCRALDWGTCDDCGCDWPEESLLVNDFAESGNACPECLAEYCTSCGVKGHCRCDEADRAYDLWKDEGRFL